MRLLYLVLVLLLPGCTVYPDMSQFRGFEVEPGVQAPYPVVVQWFAASSYTEIQELCHRAGDGFKIGCTICERNVCLVVTHANSAYEVLGHEGRHYLRWHKPSFHR